MRQPVKANYYWDFDFQDKFGCYLTGDQRPYLAIAGGVLHGDFYLFPRQLFNEQGAVELVRKKDFLHRDQGYSINRAIRDNRQRIVKVIDQKTKRPMRAMPDVVDYRHDHIYDLKTYFINEPPDPGGVFITVDEAPGSVPDGDRSPDFPIPAGYEDAWSNLKRIVQADLDKKYRSQFARYHQAYFQATNRHPTISIYVVLYTKTAVTPQDQPEDSLRKI